MTQLKADPDSSCYWRSWRFYWYGYDLAIILYAQTKTDLLLGAGVATTTATTLSTVATGTTTTTATGVRHSLGRRLDIG